MLHGCIDDEGARRMAEGEEEDMDRRRGILCTFFLEAGRLRFLFSAQKQNNRFLHGTKKQEGKETERVWRGRKTDCWARAYPGVPVSRIESGQCFFVQEWARRGLLCVIPWEGQ
jgi:hypothetical protein